MLFLEHKHLLRQPYTRDPVPVAGVPDPVRPGSDRGRRRRAHHRHLGRHGREVPAGGRQPRPREDGSSVQVDRPALTRAVGPGAGGERGGPHRPAARRPRGRAHQRLRGRGGGVGRPSTASRPRRPGRPGSGPPTPTWPTSPAWDGHPAPGRRHRRRPPGRCWPSSISPCMSEVRAACRCCGRKAHPVRLETVVVPDPGPGEAVVAVQACGVCHTDLHYREGAINDDFPSSSATRPPARWRRSGRA